MDYNTQTPPQMPMQSPEPVLHKKHPLRAPIVIITLLVVAAFLVIGFMRMKEDKAIDMAVEEKQSELLDTDSQAKALSTQSTGTDTASLQADINATDVSNIEAE